MITSQDREIQALVNDIRDGKLLLPEMQRGYVWKAPQVRNLLDSLYRNYPSGQLLVWETDDLPFSRKVSVDAVDNAQRRPQLLLDGQQRLTSLAAVMLGRPLMVRDSRRPIEIVFNVFTERFEVAGVRQRGETGWISVSKLFTGGPMRVLREVRQGLSDDDEDLVLERLTRTRWYQDLQISRKRSRGNKLRRSDRHLCAHQFWRNYTQQRGSSTSADLCSLAGCD